MTAVFHQRSLVSLIRMAHRTAGAADQLTPARSFRSTPTPPPPPLRQRPPRPPTVKTPPRPRSRAPPPPTHTRAPPPQPLERQTAAWVADRCTHSLEDAGAPDRPVPTVTAVPVAAGDPRDETAAVQRVRPLYPVRDVEEQQSLRVRGERAVRLEMEQVDALP